MGLVTEPVLVCVVTDEGTLTVGTVVVGANPLVDTTVRVVPV